MTMLEEIKNRYKNAQDEESIDKAIRHLTDDFCWLIRVAEAAQTKVDYCSCSAGIKPLCTHCRRLEELFNKE